MAVLRLLVRGLGNKAIAAELKIGEQTAKAHVTHLLRKLHAVNRAELAARAVAQHLAEPPDDHLDA